MTETPEQRLLKMPRMMQATLLRIGRRIQEGFVGEITIQVTVRGIHFIRWTQVEDGVSIKEELG